MARKRVVDPHYTRGDRHYQEVMKDIGVKGDQCPFCTFAYHPHPILWRQGNWQITANWKNYENARWHFLIIACRHLEAVQELTSQDFQDVLALVSWAVKEYGIKGGALVLRFGEAKLTGATISHLHFHLIEPLLGQETGRAKTVYFPIG